MFSFPHLYPDLDILFEKLTGQIGFKFEKHLLHNMPQRLGILCACLLFLTSLVVTHTLMP